MSSKNKGVTRLFWCDLIFLKSILQELQEFQSEIVQLNNSIQDKSREILSLDEQLRRKPKVPVNEDLDNRLQTLTQTLMTKQNTLEAVTTERNALCLQLEKLETEYQNLLQSSRKQVKIPIESEPYEGNNFIQGDSSNRFIKNLCA